MDDNTSNCGCIAYIILALIIIAIVFGFSYLIAISDLPDWFKFYLLS